MTSQTQTIAMSTTGPHPVQVQFRMLEDGAFVAGAIWASIGRRSVTCYAYPTSPDAVAARKNPAKVARAMIAREFASTSPYKRDEYDASNWARIDA